MTSSLGKLNKIRDLWIVSEKLVPSGFARVLGTDPTSMLSSNAQGLQYDFHSNQYSLRYTIPERACLNQRIRRIGRDEEKITENVFPLSAFIALFDEFSTWAITAEDTSGRPGLSTHLSASLIGSDTKQTDWLGPGDVVDVIARVSKTGKVLSFAEVQAICARTGRMICVGRHTKYLPSGSLVQDIALGPSMMPLTKLYTSLLPSNSQNNSPIPTMKDLISWQDREITYGNVYNAKIHVTTDHCNPTGSFHGGCQAIAMEQLSHLETSPHEHDFTLKSMSISYMSTGKRQVSFTQRSLQTSHKSHTSVVQARGSNDIIVSEGILHYE